MYIVGMYVALKIVDIPEKRRVPSCLMLIFRNFRIYTVYPSSDTINESKYPP